MSTLATAIFLLSACSSYAVDRDLRDRNSHRSFITQKNIFPQRLFGVFNFPPTQAQNWPFSATRLDGNLQIIDVADQVKLKVLVSLTGSKRNYTDSNGCFDLQRWKAKLDQSDVRKIQDYIESGTIIGLYALDEPHDWNRFGACKEVRYEDLNAVCAYAHSKWPSISCGVNAPLEWLSRGLKRTDFRHLDFLFTQYNFRQGSARRWVEKQEFDARQFGEKKLYISMNAVASAPDPVDLMEAGRYMCQADVTGVFIWKWGDTFDKPGMAEAMKEIAKTCLMQQANSP